MTIVDSFLKEDCKRPFSFFLKKSIFSGIKEATNFTCKATNEDGETTVSEVALVEPITVPDSPELEISEISSNFSVLSWKYGFDGYAPINSITIQVDF